MCIRDSKKSERLKRLAELGFEMVEWTLVDKDSLPGEIESRAEHVPHLGYPSDGLVLTYDDVDYSATLGQTAKFPRASMAFKWQDEMCIRDSDLSVGPVPRGVFDSPTGQAEGRGLFV